MEQAIKDKAPKPPGLIPKNLQAFVIVGLALLMVVIMAVTGHKRPTSPSTAMAPALPNLLPVNSQKVTDLQKEIEQTQRESAPQVEAALLQRQRQLASQAARSGQPLPPTPYGTPVTASDPSGTYPPGAYAATLPQGAENQTPSDPIRDEQKKRAYLSLFSDNVALTYRKELHSEGRSPASNPTTNGPVPRATTMPDTSAVPDPLFTQAAAELAREGQLLGQAQQADLALQSPFPSAPQTSPKAARALTTVDQGHSDSSQSKVVGSAHSPAVLSSHDGKDYVLFEGTVLEALLINRLDGTFAGPVTCLLSNNVYSVVR